MIKIARMARVAYCGLVMSIQIFTPFDPKLPNHQIVSTNGGDTNERA